MKKSYLISIIVFCSLFALLPNNGQCDESTFPLFFPWGNVTYTDLFDQETTTLRIEAADTVAETVYRIISRTTLDFITVGAADNNIGTIFIATGVDTLGSGDALDEITSPHKGIFGWPYLAGPLENSGNPTDNTFYRIVARSIVDFTTIGSPDNVVGTYFYSTGTAVTLSGVDNLRPVQTSWTPFAGSTNIIEIDEAENAFKVTGVDHGFGASLLLSDSKDLGSDLVVGQKYLFTIVAKIGAGDAANIRIWDGSASIHFDSMTTSFATYTGVFTAQSATVCQFSFNALGVGEEAWIRSVAIYER